MVLFAIKRLIFNLLHLQALQLEGVLILEIICKFSLRLLEELIYILYNIYCIIVYKVAIANFGNYQLKF